MSGEGNAYAEIAATTLISTGSGSSSILFPWASRNSGSNSFECVWSWIAVRTVQSVRVETHLEDEVGDVDEKQQYGGSSRDDLQTVDGVFVEAVEAEVNVGIDCRLDRPGNDAVHFISLVNARVRLGAVVGGRNDQGCTSSRQSHGIPRMSHESDDTEGVGRPSASGLKQKVQGGATYLCMQGS